MLAMSAISVHDSQAGMDKRETLEESEQAEHCPSCHSKDMLSPAWLSWPKTEHTRKRNCLQVLM